MKEANVSKNKNVKKRDKKSKKKPLLRKKFLLIIQFIAAVATVVTVLVGCITILVMRDINKTDNLLYLRNDIQNRTDAVFLIGDELSSYKLLFQNASEEEEEHIRITKNKQIGAIFAMLRAYEFACWQYLKGNVDRQAFKDLYGDGTLENLLKDHEGLIGKGYPLIKKVNKMWQ